MLATPNNLPQIGRQIGQIVDSVSRHYLVLTKRQWAYDCIITIVGEAGRKLLVKARPIAFRRINITRRAIRRCNIVRRRQQPIQRRCQL